MVRNWKLNLACGLALVAIIIAGASLCRAQSLTVAQGNTSVNLVFGPVVQASDHSTPITGLTTSGGTITATGGTTSTITSATSATAGQELFGASGVNAGAIAYVQSVSGGGPYTITIAPAFSSSPSNGDTFTASNFTIRLSKNGATFATPVAGLSEAGFGFYSVLANASDAGTNGSLVLHWTVLGGTAGDPGNSRYQVVSGGIGIGNLMNFPIDPTGTPINFQDAMFECWAVAAGKSTASYSGVTQTTNYYRTDGTTVGHSTTLTADAMRRPISRTYTAGTLP